MTKAENVKAKIRGLIDRSNEVTERTDTDLTTAMDALIELGGSGGSCATEENDAGGLTYKIKVGDTSGGGFAVEEKDVNFYDYDGTLLYSYTVNAAKKLTELPPLPSHEGLICQEWNHTLEEVNGVEVAMNIGANYITDDGKTRLYIETRTNAYSFALSLTSLNGVSMLDWGDGSPVETIPAGQASSMSHSYELKGTYIIKIEVPEGSQLLMGDGTSTHPLIEKTNHAYNTVNTILTKAEIGERAGFRDYVFYGCSALEAITIPKIPSNAFYYQTSFGQQSFYGTKSLRCVVFPMGTDVVGYQAFQSSGVRKVIFSKNIRVISTHVLASADRPERIVLQGGVIDGSQSYMFSSSRVREVIFEKDAKVAGYMFSSSHITHVVLPANLQSLAKNLFNGCSQLRSIDIPDTVSSILSDCFNGCTSLVEVIMPKSLASIGASAFYYCRDIQLFDFTKCAVVPTLANTNAFTNVHKNCQFLVPAALYDEWIAATNWTTYADKIVAV